MIQTQGTVCLNVTTPTFIFKHTVLTQQTVNNITASSYTEALHEHVIFITTKTPQKFSKTDTAGTEILFTKTTGLGFMNDDKPLNAYQSHKSSKLSVPCLVTFGKQSLMRLRPAPDLMRV